MKLRNDEEKSIIERGKNYIKSYFSLPSILILGSGAVAGFAIGTTSKLTSDFFEFVYSSASYAYQNFPNYDLVSSAKYTSQALKESILNAFAEGTKAAPIYGIGTLVFAKLVKRTFYSIFKRR